jgi:alkylation response protein AidB-like acyl-CoA dehydrogenase
MSPLCQLEMTLPAGYPGVLRVTVRLMSDGELRRQEVPRDLDQRRLTTEGGAQRAHDIAADCARRRTTFGRPLGEHEGVGFMLADNAMDIHQSRLVIWHTAWVLDQGERGTHESSMGKVIRSEAIWRVVDRSMQILGGLGITDDTIVARLFRDVRPFRIYDGPSEVHRWSIARRVLRAGTATFA